MGLGRSQAPNLWSAPMQYPLPVLLAASFASVSAASAATLSVDAGGGADFTDIQSAVWAAEPGDTIQVHPGTYTGAGTAVVWIPDMAITIEGLGDPTDVIIDGEGERYGFQVDTSLESSMISNITVTQTLGAGIRMYSSRPTISNCLFTECDGSAIIAVGTADAVVQSCEIWGNTGDRGAAIWNAGANLNIQDCEIHHNTTTDTAAVYHNLSSGSLYISGCDIHHNTSGSGGGINSVAPIVVLSDTKVHHNTTSYGGAVYLTYAASASLDNCDVSWNAGTGINAAHCSMVSISNTSVHANANFGIYAYSSPMHMTACTVTAHDTSGAGWGSALYLYGASHTITGTTIAGNIADNAPAIHVGWDTSAAADDCTIVNNTCNWTSEYVSVLGAWLSDGESLTIGNSDLCNNTPTDLDEHWTLGDLGSNTYDAFCTWCPGDVDGSLQTGLSDVLWLVDRWACADCAGDYDGDGQIGVGDLMFVLEDWGCVITDPV